MTSPTGPDGHESPAQGYPGYGSGHGYAPAPAYLGASTYNGEVLPFPDAVRSALAQYATFTGRARRSEYWWFALFNLGLSMVAAVLDAVLGAPLTQWIVALGLLVPSLAVAVRRLHDIGRSGWWLLITLVPLAGAVILIVFLCTDGERGANRWGPSPKYGV